MYTGGNNFNLGFLDIALYPLEIFLSDLLMIIFSETIDKLKSSWQKNYRINVCMSKTISGHF